MDNVPNNNSVNTEAPVAPVSPTSSQTKVLGVERRLIGFGFGLFFMLLILAVLYSIFTRQPAEAPAHMKPMLDQPQSVENAMNKKMAVPGVVTPDVVVDDLVDEAVADNADLTNYESDEMADIEDGSNN